MIREKSGKNGISYCVEIRKKGTQIYKTFYSREDAELYDTYKTNLIQNMENFEVPIQDRVTLAQLYELKEKQISEPRAVAELRTSLEKINECIKKHTFINELTYEDWEECLKNLENTKVYVGAEKKINERNPSLSTLRRYLANTSSVISYANSLGIPVKNHALTVIQTHLNKKIKEERKNKILMCK